MGRPRILPDIKCLNCNKKFRPKDSIKKFCSRKCSYEKRPKKGINIICKICKESFYIRKSIIKKNNYCSKKCADRALIKGKEKKCKLCGKGYFVPISQEKYRGESKYCSLKCRIEYKHKNYVAGKRKKKTTNAILKKHLWNYFSIFIRQRDGGVCISCGKKDFWRNMDAGHYIPKTAGLSLYFDERNVNCQCTYCNRWMHGNLSRYAIALRQKYGENILEELDKERVKIKKFSDEEYIKLIEKYKTIKF